MSDSTLPIVDDSYTRRVFDALTQMEVDLDDDPLVFGPKRLNSKVALCRQHLSRCQQIFLQLSDDLHRLNRAHRQAKLDYDLQMQDMLANDPEVRAGRNVRDREAVAATKLRAEREEIFRLETSIQDLDAVMTVVKAKREDLKDIQGRIRDQVKLCQEEINLGAKWGTAPPPGTKAPSLEDRPRVDPKALDQFNDLVGSMGGESSVSDLDQFVKQELAARGEPAPEDDVQKLLATIDEEDEEGEEEIAPTPPPRAAAPEPVPPAAEPEPAPTEEVLPEVEAKAPPSGTATSEDVDDFFNNLDLEGAARKAAKTGPKPPVATDVDLDELISTFE